MYCYEFSLSRGTTSAHPGGRNIGKTALIINLRVALYVYAASSFAIHPFIHSLAPLRRTVLEPAQSGDGARTRALRIHLFIY